MARFTTTVHSPLSATDAFTYMADLRNFAEWDPGVSRSKMVEGHEPGLGTAYDVSVTGATLRYETVEYNAPHRVVAEAKNAVLRSYDIIEVSETASGCEVIYDATLTLLGPLGLADPLLGVVFDRIGDRAADGLAKALNGTRIG